MKYCLLFFIAVTSSLNAQINVVEKQENKEIGEITILGTFYASLERSGNDIIFLYKDVNYEQIAEVKSFSFKDVDNALNTFYDTMKKGLEERSKEMVTLDLPNDTVILVFKGRKVYIDHTDKNTNINGRTLNIGINQLDKLFGLN